MRTTSSCVLLQSARAFWRAYSMTLAPIRWSKYCAATCISILLRVFSTSSIIQPQKFLHNTRNIWCQRQKHSRISHMSDPVMQESSSPDIKKGSQRSLIGYTVVALGLALAIRFFIAAPYVVSGASMEPNFDNWNYLIVDRVSYGVEDPQRGDVIIFDLPQEGGRSLIKRIIGLPGETVILKGQSITIVNDKHPEGLTLEEPYLDPE